MSKHLSGTSWGAQGHWVSGAETGSAHSMEDIDEQVICFLQLLLGLVLNINFTNESDLRDYLIQ